MLNLFNKEGKSILNTIINLTYYMRGSIQYDRIMNMTYVERQMISEFIEKRIDMQSKTPYPIL